MQNVFFRKTNNISKMKIAKLSIVILLGVIFTSCASKYELLLRSADVDLKYKGAFEYFEQKKYKKAADLFEQILIATKGTEKDDTVQFYFGLSNYHFGDLETAETNFDQFTKVFPRSPFTEEARFLRLDCLYESTYRYELDQLPTYRAMSAINEFLYDYPNTKYLVKCKDMLVDMQERLDRKGYEAAKIYFTIEDYKAATFALKNAIKENPDNRYREDIMYYLVLSQYRYAAQSVKEKQKERYMVLIDEYYNFVSEFPDSKYRKSVDGMFEKAQSETNNK
jgi:outer membrane protein assembly factor BamD